MARKKVKLQYIEDHAARKVTYTKRKTSLVKKTEELSVMCGIDTCMILYGPFDPAPVVWPSSDAEARSILLDYKGKSDIELGHKKQNQEDFLRESVKKLGERIMRLQRREREMEMENIIIDLLSGSAIQQVPFSDLEDLMWVIGDKLRTVQHEIRKRGEPGVDPGANLNIPLETDMKPGNNAVISGNGDASFEAKAGPFEPFHYEPEPQQMCCPRTPIYNS